MDTSLLLVIVLVVHVVGAVFGFGPSVAYAVLGPAAGKASPQGGLAIMEAMIEIEKRLIFPFAVAIQPLSGLALIFLAGYNVNFFSHYWLWVSILLYAVAFGVGLFVQIPLIERLPKLAAELKGAPGPDFLALVKRSQTIGPVLTVLLSIIIVLMVTKPGA